MSLSSQLSRALGELHNQSEDIRGSVVATPDGFILAAFGTLESDTAAATAVHITQVVEQHLSLLQPSPCGDQLIWTEHAIWYICRLTDGYILMAVAEAHCSAGMLRLVCRSVDDALRAMLAQTRHEIQTLASPL